MARVLKDADEAYLKYVHHELAKVNYANYHKLRQGQEIPGLEGLRGEDLDRALVRLEQQHVQRLTDQYFKDRPKAERKTIMENISRASDPTSQLGLFRAGAGNDVVREAIKRGFPRGTYNFDNPEHRVKLGDIMLDIVKRWKYASNRETGR